MHSLIDLYKIKNRIINSELNSDGLLETIEELILKKETQILQETTSATGGPSVSGGMGAVVSSQPSGLAGQTIGQNWASGGSDGSGDIGVPYNPSGSNRVFQKIPAPMGKGHGPRTGKKSREKKLDMKALKAAFDKRGSFNKPKDRKGSVMNFDDFAKKDINSIKKFSESIRLVSDRSDEPSPLEKEFGVKLNTNRFLSDSETNYDIYKDDNKIGYLIISEDVYDDYELKQEYGDVVYLSFIRLSQNGHLRSVIEELKNIYNDKDGIILQIEPSDLEKYKTLKSKYESVGFEGIIPDSIGEFYIDVDDDIDIYEDPIFMILKY
jgi:hypothetical protein